MAEVSIDVTSPKTGRSLVLNKDFGTDLADSVAKFGEKAVHSNFVRMASQDVGNVARRLLNDEKWTPESVVAKLAEWKPGVTMPRSSAPVDPVGAFIAQIATMTPEQRASEFNRIKEALKAAQG